MCRKLSWSLGLALVLWAGPLLGQDSGGGALIDEDFSSGFDPAIFEPIGAGVSLEVDPDTGKLKVHVKNTEEGLRINIPQDLPGDPTARCMHLQQDISRHEFPRGFGWVHVVHMQNTKDPDDQVTVELRAVRSFWNRCLYKLKYEGTTVETGFLAPVDGAAAKWPCPEVKDVAFDWLPPEMEGGPERIQIEVSAAAAADCKFKTTKPTPIQHDPGGGGGNPPDKPYRITKWDIVSRREDPDFDPGGC